MSLQSLMIPERGFQLFNWNIIYSNNVSNCESYQDHTAANGVFDFLRHNSIFPFAINNIKQFLRKMQIKCCDKSSRIIANAANNNLLVDEKKEESGNVDLEMKGIGFRRPWWDKESPERNNEIEPSDNSSQSSGNTFVERINVQDWMDLGKPCQRSYSTDMNEMKDTLCSLLNFRLEKLADSRSDSCRSDSSRNLITTITHSIAQYVERICELYIINDYHNFHHAYHVTLSINKLVEMMIVNNHILHDDYLTHFALVFSALVHDVGHKG